MSEKERTMRSLKVSTKEKLIEILTDARNDSKFMKQAIKNVQRHN